MTAATPAADGGELVARLRALMRRGNLPVVERFDAGGLVVDVGARTAAYCGRAIELGTTEFRLLEFLARNAGIAFSRAQLLDGVWGREVYIDERTVDVHAGRLRKALNRGRSVDPIRTVRGSGYSLDEHFLKVA